MAQLRITQVRSTIGATPQHRGTVRALGLRPIRHTVVKADTPTLRGMLARVRHLVRVEEIP